jgi:hypothetical protein
VAQNDLEVKELRTTHIPGQGEYVALDPVMASTQQCFRNALSIALKDGRYSPFSTIPSPVHRSIRMAHFQHRRCAQGGGVATLRMEAAVSRASHPATRRNRPSASYITYQITRRHCQQSSQPLKPGKQPSHELQNRASGIYREWVRFGKAEVLSLSISSNLRGCRGDPG